jgi:hypothetical protein
MYICTTFGGTLYMVSFFIVKPPYGNCRYTAHCYLFGGRFIRFSQIPGLFRDGSFRRQ